ncbi:TonB-dependent receptor [Sphingomonas sp. ASY06-1R]|uniref:TonB-dependent receptor n=1 Tax=Sphingomonas sp. ASY06-1R TaxID=3445771 RepID=UPI003FA2F23C
MSIAIQGRHPSCLRKAMLAGASSMIALVVAAPVAAQTDTTNNPSTQNGTVVQPATPSSSNLTAQQAGQPQDTVTPGSTASTEEEIVVTGLRGSLQRNLDIKRSAAGVVDAISAEDIGKFPDSNLAASLQRLPGVSIQRDGARGEPTGITVRGFGGDFNETLYDGRRISTASGGRSVDFSTVGSDFVGQLNVLKTPDVSLSSSSIGATVNVQFPKPFDHPGLRIAASGSGSYQTRSDKAAATGGLLFSDTFADDTLGILVDGIYTNHKTKTNRVFVSGWVGGYLAPCQLTPTCTAADLAGPKNKLSWFEQQYGAEQSYVNDERIDGRIALQWHPSENLLLTIDDNYSRQKLRTNISSFGIWFNGGDLRNVQLDDNGTVVNFVQNGSPTDFNATRNTRILRTNQVGGNVKWDASEHLHVEGDVSYAQSKLNPGIGVSSDNADVGYGGAIGTPLGIKITGNSDKSFPELTTYGPQGNQSRWLDQSLIGSHVTVRQLQQNSDRVKQAKLQATWEQDNLSIRAGGTYLDDKYHLEGRDTFANNYWQAYSGYGSASGRDTGVMLPSSLFQGTIGLKDFIPGFSGNLPPALLKYDPRAYQAYLSGLGNPQQKNIPGFNYGAPTVGTNFTGAFDLATNIGGIQTIREKTWAAFLRVNYTAEIAGMPFHFNAGLRRESTNLSSSGFGRLPLTIIQNSGDPTLLTVATYTPTQPITTKSNYHYLLPSVDLKLEATDKLTLRFDASRTLTRPALNTLNPVLDVGSGQRVGALTASGGNPLLQPYLSDNYDVAAEWYYKRNSYFAIDGFIKNVSNFIVAGVTRQTINGVVDPSTGAAAVFSVSARVNGPSATVRGVELAWQHVFGDSGFGFNANATFVDTNKPYDRNDISSSGFAVTGLANSANFVGFYDKNGFQFRAAVNWRDEYLLQFGQNQNTSAFGAEPTFVNSQVQVDLSTSYEINKHISVFAEALNINNSTYSTHGRFKNQLLDVYSYGRRFTLGAHLKF